MRGRRRANKNVRERECIGRVESEGLCRVGERECVGRVGGEDVCRVSEEEGVRRIYGGEGLCRVGESVCGCGGGCVWGSFRVNSA